MKLQIFQSGTNWYCAEMEGSFRFLDKSGELKQMFFEEYFQMGTLRNAIRQVKKKFPNMRKVRSESTGFRLIFEN